MSIIARENADSQIRRFMPGTTPSCPTHLCVTEISHITGVETKKVTHVVDVRFLIP